MFVRWSGSNAQRYIQYISQKIKSIVPKKKNLEELKHAAWIMKGNRWLHSDEMEQSPRDYTDPLSKTV